MAATKLDREYVRAAAQAVGLELAPDRVDAVVEALERIEPIAARLMDVPLGEEDELAPIWRP